MRPTPSSPQRIQGCVFTPKICRPRVAAGLGLQINTDKQNMKTRTEISVGAGHRGASPLHISCIPISIQARAARLVTINPPLAFSAPR